MSGSTTLHDGTFRLDPLSIRAARVPIGPVRIGGEVFEMRPHRWTDGPAWSATRMADEERFRASFGSASDEWSDTSSMRAWVEHLNHLRRATRNGLMVPFVVLHDDGRVVGEINFHLDPGSGSAEISLWFARGTSREAAQWMASSAIFRVFALPARVPRLMAPIAQPNPGPRRLLAHFGFAQAAVARELREFDGERVDHDIWWLDRTAEHLAGLARGLTDPTF